MKLISVSVPSGESKTVIKVDGNLYLQRLASATTPTDYYTDTNDPTGSAVTVQLVTTDTSVVTENHEVDLKDVIFDNEGGQYNAVYFPVVVEKGEITIDETQVTYIGKHPTLRSKKP